jgi:hypothetical protein
MTDFVYYFSCPGGGWTQCSESAFIGIMNSVKTLACRHEGWRLCKVAVT